MNKNRRRTIKIIGLTTSMMLMPKGVFATEEVQKFTWEGYALGADSSVQLYGFSKTEFDTVIEGAVSLIARLEKIFSLYDPSSEINALNNNGKLENASPEMVDLLQISKNITAQTDGAFDITVQPLWQHYEEYRNTGDELAFENGLASVLKLIGSDKLNIDGRRVWFSKDNMAISSNGIAQGYITDKVTEYLMERGFEHVLVDVGEYRAAGPQANGDPWRIGLLDPFDQISVADVMELSNGGLATSGGYGTVFDDDGKKHHLFNPATGLSTQLYASVTVKAENATLADALSTAFSSMSKQGIKNYLRKFQNVTVRLTDRNGSVRKLTS